ncbi:hypothetical protein [Sinomonas sp.]|jgi:hypothetical protein|uniref:hypothetical protein n=1 Tax=Sinomonas sp. TaxID=1914986 RepID=UPI002FE14BB4
MEEFDCLVVYVPTADADGLRRAIAEAGAGRLGNYAACSFSTEGTGRFLPLDGARPAVGTVGEPEEVPETRIEAIYRRVERDAIVRALVAAHPYETPAFMTFPVDVSLPPEG